MTAAREWQSLYFAERDQHTLHLSQLAELREQVSRAVEEIQRGEIEHAVIRLRRARVRDRPAVFVS